MTIDPKTLPDCTVVEITVDQAQTIVYARGDGYIYDTAAPLHRWTERRPITRVFVPVPDGMTLDDATRALDDARWVVVDTDEGLPDGTRIREIHRGRIGKHEGRAVEFRVHPDDVPTDSDADLIEAAAKAALDAWLATSSGGDACEAAARAALAVVREQEARA